MLTRRACCCGAPSCSICVHVTVCAGTDLAGATVTFKKGAVTVGTCTTSSSGICCLDVTAEGAGTYTVSVAKTGFVGSNKTVNVACPGVTNVELLAEPIASTWGMTVLGCHSVALPGATFTIDGGTYVSDGSGHIAVPLGTGSYPWTLTYSPYFVTQTGTLVHSTCGSTATGIPTMPMTAESDYICDPFISACDPLPLPRTIHVTSAVGTCTITRVGSDWIGCGQFSSPHADSRNNASLSCLGTSTTADIGYICETTNLGNLNFTFAVSTTTPQTYTSNPATSCPTLPRRCNLTVTPSIAIDFGSLTVVSCDPFAATATISGQTGIRSVWNGPVTMSA